ncbi:MAG: DUF6504 family protein [Planctomycetota bacterium]|jgi:hypothetical protein
MARFVSEALEPLPGAFETGDMGRGEPGLPLGFRWRGEERRIAERLARGKQTSRAEGELYVRRHTFRLRMDDGAVWNVYFLRQSAKGASRAGKRMRWFLLSTEGEG